MKTPTEFATDMRLVFENALTYGQAIQVDMYVKMKYVLHCFPFNLWSLWSLRRCVRAHIFHPVCRSGKPVSVQANLLDLAEHLLKFFNKVRCF